MSDDPESPPSDRDDRDRRSSGRDGGPDRDDRDGGPDRPPGGRSASRFRRRPREGTKIH
ncbi:hypothetical protein [Halalkaliarchaeum desulfuricum]|uniref:hypothetical protein n=1 Tax=Halalkaliarchaeum desulfuricum TaxID=2055893 RepID=UPI0012B54ECE|nr:hypothetical protein [Halalkaliarchaeum desulfuricum]